MPEEKKKRKYTYTEKENERGKRYKREHMTSIAFRLSNERDAELIEIYNAIDNKADFFRNALRRYAEEHNIKTEDQ